MIGNATIILVFHDFGYHTFQKLLPHKESTRKWTMSIASVDYGLPPPVLTASLSHVKPSDCL